MGPWLSISVPLIFRALPKHPKPKENPIFKMIAFILLLAVAGSLGAPSNYGYSMPTLPPIRVSSYAPPPIRKVETYAPIRKVESYAPVRKVESYAPAPALKVDSYASYAAPEIRKPMIPITSFLKTDDNYGSYSLSTLGGDGQSFSEEGSLRNLPGDKEGPVNVKQGSYEWNAPDGQHFSVSYIADENGFRASGAHFPVAPVDENHKNLPLPVRAQTHYS